MTLGYIEILKTLEKVHVSEAIPDGTYVFPDNTNQAVKKFLRHLKRTNNVSKKEPPTLISLAAYI